MEIPSIVSGFPEPLIVNNRKHSWITAQERTSAQIGQRFRVILYRFRNYTCAAVISHANTVAKQSLDRVIPRLQNLSPQSHLRQSTVQSVDVILNPRPRRRALGECFSVDTQGFAFFDVAPTQTLQAADAQALLLGRYRDRGLGERCQGAIIGGLISSCRRQDDHHERLTADLETDLKCISSSSQPCVSVHVNDDTHFATS